MQVLPKILFVCYADSSHAQSWIRLLEDAPFDVRVFASPFPSMGIPPTWAFPTYSVVQPMSRPDQPRCYWRLPAHGLLMRKLITRLDRDKLHLSEIWLRRIIRTWQPDIVHTLRMSAEGGLTLRALKGISAARRPTWIVSAWGVDIRWHIRLPEYRKQVLEILRTCDGFCADCQGDLNIAMANGLMLEKIMPGAPLPGTGGLDLQLFSELRQRVLPTKRKIVLVPKAMESIHLKAVTVVEALRLANEAGVLKDAEIWLLMCSPAVREWVSLMPESLQNICHCCDILPHERALDLMSQARVMVAPSLVDGSPNVMWEAMSTGALPVLSPLDSIREVITDGQNGLLASALSCDQIAQGIIRAMTDDVLVEDAARRNWEIVQQRANREKIKPVVIGYYHKLTESRNA